MFPKAKGPLGHQAGGDEEGVVHMEASRGKKKDKFSLAHTQGLLSQERAGDQRF